MSMIAERTREGVRMTASERSERAKMISDLYREGWSLSEIAQVVNRSRERVRQILAERGEVLRASGFTPEQRAERMQRLRERIGA